MNTTGPQPYEINGLRVDPPDLTDRGAGHVFDETDGRPILTWSETERSWRVFWLRFDGEGDEALLGGRRGHVEDVLDAARQHVLAGRTSEVELEIEEGQR